MAQRWPTHFLGHQDETRPKEEQLEKKDKKQVSELLSSFLYNAAKTVR
jgi:hypothetical protein